MRHTQDVERELSAIQSSVANAETAQRGFLLTGTASYLTGYTAARRDLPVSMRRISVLVSDNVAQQRRVRLLATLTRDKMTELDSTIRLAQGRPSRGRAGHRAQQLR